MALSLQLDFRLFHTIRLHFPFVLLYHTVFRFVDPSISYNALPNVLLKFYSNDDTF